MIRPFAAAVLISTTGCAAVEGTVEGAIDAGVAFAPEYCGFSEARRGRIRAQVNARLAPEHMAIDRVWCPGDPGNPTEPQNGPPTPTPPAE